MPRHIWNVLLLIFCLTVKSSAQIDQRGNTLSQYLKRNFPYGSHLVTERNCDSLFTGFFYVTFKLSKTGRCESVRFYGLTNERLEVLFKNLFKSDSLYFDRSFRKKIGRKRLCQPVCYTLYDCVNELPFISAHANEDCSIDEQLLAIQNRLWKRLMVSFENIDMFKEDKEIFEAIILNPCLIDTDPHKKKTK